MFQALGIPLPAVWPENTDDGYPLLLSSWILFGISTVFLAGRYWSKIAILKRFSLDDWLMLLAWVSCARQANWVLATMLIVRTGRDPRVLNQPPSRVPPRPRQTLQ